MLFSSERAKNKTPLFNLVAERRPQTTLVISARKHKTATRNINSPKSSS
jgi:hypothetical protein